MYKLGCYVSENDILSALSVMIVYFAIHHVLFEYIPLYYHLTCKRKKIFFLNEQNTLAERIHRDLGVLSTPQLCLGSPWPPVLPALPAPEAIRVATLSVEFHGRETHSWKPKLEVKVRSTLFCKVLCVISGPESGSQWVVCRIARRGQETNRGGDRSEVQCLQIQDKKLGQPQRRTGGRWCAFEEPQRSRSGPWFSCSVVSNSCDLVDWSQPGSSVLGISQAKMLGRKGCPFLIQGICLAHNSGLLQCRQVVYWLSHQGSPKVRVSDQIIIIIKERCESHLRNLVWVCI